MVLPNEIAAVPGSEADRRPCALRQLPADFPEHRHEVMLHVVAEEESGLPQLRDDTACDSQEDGENCHDGSGEAAEADPLRQLDDVLVRHDRLTLSRRLRGHARSS